MHKSLRKLLLSFRYWRLDRSLPAFTEPTFTKIAAPVFSIPEMCGDIEEHDTSQVVIFAACDNGYYRKFGRAFIGSILGSGSDSPVHLHLVNPAPGTLEELRLLRQRLPSGVLSFTWEQVDLSHLSPEEAGIYYYTIRFWRLNQFMAATKCKCLCLDIDALLRMNSNALLDELRSTDIAFYSRFHKFGGNTKLLAGTLFVSNSRAGQAFIRQSGQQIFRFFSAGIFLEKFDQQVLYDMYRKAEKQFPGLVFRSLRQPEIDLDFTEQGTIWYPKGSSKRQAIYVAAEQVCRQYVDELLKL